MDEQSNSRKGNKYKFEQRKSSKNKKEDSILNQKHIRVAEMKKVHGKENRK